MHDYVRVRSPFFAHVGTKARDLSLAMLTRRTDGVLHFIYVLTAAKMQQQQTDRMAGWLAESVPTSYVPHVPTFYFASSRRSEASAGCTFASSVVKLFRIGRSAKMEASRDEWRHAEMGPGAGSPRLTLRAQKACL